MKVRFAWTLIVLLVSASLALSGCEAKKPANEGETANAEKKADKKTAVEPEDELMEAMREVADILTANQADPHAAIAALRAYSTENEERLKVVVENLRAKMDSFLPKYTSSGVTFPRAS